MATQPYTPTAYTIPDNTGGGPRERLLMTSRGALHVLLDDEAIDDRVRACPAGTRMVVAQPRMCGDWYVEIEGVKHVSAIGATKDEAFLSALAKAA